MNSKPDRCGFEPSLEDQATCRYYKIVSEIDLVDLICLNGENIIITCPHRGNNPYPTEEDSYE